MGNIVGNRMALSSFPQNVLLSKDKYEPVATFKFHDILPEETNNGLYLCDSYFPEEVVTIILSHVEPKHLLKCSEVCRKWCNIIKSDTFWAHLYYRRTHKKPKKLPWYVYYCYLTTDYFDKNFIKNGNGQEQFKHWKIIQNYGDQFRIEDPPVGADPLPTEDVPEFCGKTSCFATSYYECNKLQEINFENNRLLQLILDRHKPNIYLSEWVAGRFDCGCVYNLWCKLFGTASDGNKDRTTRTRTYSGSSDEYDDFVNEEFYEGQTLLHERNASHRIEQWAGASWTKIELVIVDYPKGVKKIVFQHEGRDTQFWKGHYGSKMAGGVLKIGFNSIKPLT